MKNCYSAPANTIQNCFSSYVIEISCINVLSPIWIQTFGNCFASDIQTIYQNYEDLGNTYKFDSDFDCTP